MARERLFEACVDSFASCEIAKKAGADRIELCANLIIGGTTPSQALKFAQSSILSAPALE